MSDDEIKSICKTICRDLSYRTDLSQDEKTQRAKDSIQERLNQSPAVTFSDHDGGHTAMYMGMINSPTTGKILKF